MLTIDSYVVCMEVVADYFFFGDLGEEVETASDGVVDFEPRLWGDVWEIFGAVFLLQDHAVLR